MKTSTLLAATLFTLVATGCKPSQPVPPPALPTTTTEPSVTPQATTPAPSPVPTASATTTGTATSAPTPAANTAQATAGSYAAKKSDFVHIMRAQLDEANNEINALDSLITTATKQDKEMSQPKIDVLRGQAQNIKVQLNNADTISEAGWDNFTEQVDKAYADLKDATVETRTWLNNYLNHKSI